MKSILMYQREILDFGEVTSKLLSEEKRLKSEGHTLQESSILASSKWKKKEFVKKKLGM